MFLRQFFCCLLVVSLSVSFVPTTAFAQEAQEDGSQAVIPVSPEDAITSDSDTAEPNALEDSYVPDTATSTDNSEGESEVYDEQEVLDADELSEAEQEDNLEDEIEEEGAFIDETEGAEELEDAEEVSDENSDKVSSQGKEKAETELDTKKDTRAKKSIQALSDELARGDVIAVGNDQGQAMQYTITSLNETTKTGTVAVGDSTHMKPTISASYTGEVTIPRQIRYQGITFTVNKIGPQAFGETTDAKGFTTYVYRLRKITIPNTITSIESEAFLAAPNLLTVEFSPGSSLSSIGNLAFRACSLEEITLPASLNSLGTGCFMKSQLRSITFEGSNIRAFPNMCFAETRLRSFEIPASVSSIGQECFAGSRLNEIYIPATVRTLGKGVFRDCTRLDTVEFDPASPLTSIPDSTFKNCSELDSFTFNPNFTSIGEECFMGAGLETLFIPKTLQFMDKGAFSSCTYLRSVQFEDDHGLMEVQASLFEGCTSLVDITLPDNVRYINQEALSRCTSLADFTFPKNLESLAALALSDCSKLKTIRFQSDATYIQAHTSAFYRCRTLENVVFYGKRCEDLNFPSSIPTIYLTVHYYASKAAVGKNELSHVCVADRVAPASAKKADIFEGEYLALSPEGKMWAYENGFKQTNLIYDSFYAYAAGILGELKVGDRFTADTIEGATVTYTVEELASGSKTGRASVGFYPDGDGRAVDTYQTGSITIPESVIAPDGQTYAPDSIAPYAFAGCNNFISLVIPATITSIGERAFARASMLRTIRFDADANMIKDNGLFIGCSNIKTVIFGGKKANVTFGISDPDIYYTVTYYRNKLDKDASIAWETILAHENTRLSSPKKGEIYSGKIPSLSVGYEWLYENGFSGTKPLADSCWVYADGIGFQATINVHNGNVDSTLCWFKILDFDEKTGKGKVQVGLDKEGITAIHTSISGTPIIPSTIKDAGGNTYDVVTVGDYAFGSEQYWLACDSITSVVFPSSVTEIGDSAFKNCLSLKTISLPSKLEKMGVEVFKGATGLTAAVFGSRSPLTSLPDSTFMDCSALSSVALPNNLVSIGNFAFANCVTLNEQDLPIAGLKTCPIPSTVTTIGIGAFYNDKLLPSIELPKNLQSVNADAFYGCSSVSSIIFNGNASNVTFGKGAFDFGSNEYFSNVVFMDKKSTTVNNYIRAIDRRGRSVAYKTYYNVRFYLSQTDYELGNMASNLLILDDVAVAYRRDGILFGSVPSLPQGSAWRCEKGFAIDKRTQNSYYAIAGYDLAYGAITLPEYDFYYTGAPIKPIPTVSWGGRILTAGVDYELDTSQGLNGDGYSNNRRGPVAIVNVCGLGDFAGTLRAYFNISLQVDSAKSFNVSFDDVGSYIYDGKPKTPPVSVEAKLFGDAYDAREGRDYEVSYSNNVNAGTAIVVVRGLDIFGGTFAKGFKILPADIRDCDIDKFVATISGDKISVVLSLQGPAGELVEGRDYVVESYLGGSSVADATVYIRGIGNYSGTITKYLGESTGEGGGAGGGSGGGIGTGTGDGQGYGEGEGNGRGSGITTGKPNALGVTQSFNASSTQNAIQVSEESHGSVVVNEGGHEGGGGNEGRTPRIFEIDEVATENIPLPTLSLFEWLTFLLVVGGIIAYGITRRSIRYISEK